MPGTRDEARNRPAPWPVDPYSLIALLAGIFAILMWRPIVSSVVAIVVGTVALRSRRSFGDAVAAKQARAGVVLGIVALVLWFYIYVTRGAPPPGIDLGWLGVP